jgi:hypothetical protein
MRIRMILATALGIAWVTACLVVAGIQLAQAASAHPGEAAKSLCPGGYSVKHNKASDTSYSWHLLKNPDRCTLRPRIVLHNAPIGIGRCVALGDPTRARTNNQNLTWWTATAEGCIIVQPPPSSKITWWGFQVLESKGHWRDIKEGTRKAD